MARKKVETVPKSSADLLQEYAQYWQHHLRLRDWNITFRLAQDKKDTRGGFAVTCPIADHSIADIIILAPEKIPDTWAGCRDLEVTVVHELLHVRFHFCIPIGKKVNPHEEAAIELTAIALVANRRGLKAGELH